MMLEKLYYRHGNDTYFDSKASSFKANRLDTNHGNHQQAHFTVMDLVAIFTDEAAKICANRRIADLIALEVINDYVKKHVINVKIAS